MDRAGNIALGYSVSSGSLFPSIRYAGRLARDLPRGELVQGEAVMYVGTGSQTHSAERWGDYSMMAIDPGDPCTFWYSTEYYAATSQEDWRTRVGSFGFHDDCPDLTSPTPPSLTQPSMGFQTARTFAVAWAGSLDDGSGVAAYRIQRRVAPLREGWRSRKVWRHGIEQRRTSHTGRSGRTYCFEASGFDNAGNVSPRSARACTAVPVNDTALVHRGSWDERDSSGYYLDTFSRSSAQGAALILPDVIGRRLALVATTCQSCGTIEALWNGRLLSRLQLRSSARRQKQVIGLGDLGSVRRGTLEIRITSSGKTVIVEGVGVSRV